MLSLRSKSPNLPFYNWIMVNLFGLGLLALAFVQGWLDSVAANDAVGMARLLLCVFTLGLSISGYKMWVLNREVKRLQTGGGFLAAGVKGLAVRLVARISIVRFIAKNLVLLGLFGTVIGFWIVLSGADVGIIDDTSLLPKMLAGVLSGLKLMLLSTAVGTILNIWLMCDYYLLSQTTAEIVALYHDHEDGLKSRANV